MEIVTVGTYILVDGCFVFAVGPHSERPGRLAVLRVGGHREAGETPWECAVREALEETGLSIEPVPVGETLRWGRADGALAPVEAQLGGPRPLLVLPREDRPDAPANVMYLVRGTGKPAPLDVPGLLLLTPDDVVALNRLPMTLGAFRAGGGQALLRDVLPTDGLLEPFLQFQLLARLLEIGHPDLTLKE